MGNCSIYGTQHIKAGRNMLIATRSARAPSQISPASLNDFINLEPGRLWPTGKTHRRISGGLQLAIGGSWTQIECTDSIMASCLREWQTWIILITGVYVAVKSARLQHPVLCLDRGKDIRRIKTSSEVHLARSKMRTDTSRHLHKTHVWGGSAAAECKMNEGRLRAEYGLV